MDIFGAQFNDCLEELGLSVSGQSIMDIFGEALELDSPADQAKYLDRVCDGDKSFRARVESLLRASKKAGQFLERNAAKFCEEPSGKIIGRYRLLNAIGEGGFGIVYRAEQEQPVRRLVALKIIRPGMDSGQVIARFEAERQALARMDHAGIARVLDAGEASITPLGGPRPYFVMELVDGVPLTDFCDEGRLTPRERLKLFSDVCRAVQHAHQKGVIHRDLKPNNVLVARQDGLPAVKVIDFGIAKAIDQPLTDKTLVTGFEQVIGTPMYMSPEQADPGRADIDTRSDIYSLGVLMYELLTGTTPFERSRLQSASFDELRRIIREEEPPRPSFRISTLGPAALTLSSHRRSDPNKLGQQLRGELDWIVMKCLEKDRNRRYESADSLARDIERYLADEPIEACPPTSVYRLRKFLRKHRQVLVTASGFLLLLIVGGLLLGWQFIRESRAANEQVVAQAQRSHEIHTALTRITQLREQARAATVFHITQWTEARAMARRAEALLESGPVDSGLREEVNTLLRELEREENDRKMLLALDDVRLRAAELKNEAFDSGSTAAGYHVAFQEFGMNLDQLTIEETAHRIRESQISEALHAAIHDWAVAKWGEPAFRDRLWSIADIADDNDWRRQLRAIFRHERWPQMKDLIEKESARRQPVTVLLSLAHALVRAGLKDDAIIWLKKVQLQHPGDFWINTRLGLLLADQTKPELLDEACTYFRVAVALRPNSPGAHLNLGVVLKRRDKFAEAMICFQRALKLEPNYVSAHGHLGVMNETQGNLSAAIDCYRRALEIDPHSSQAYHSLGMVLSKRGDLAGAIENLQRAVDLDSAFALAHHNLASLQFGAGDMPKAAEYFRKTVKIDPRRAISFHGLGRALVQLGDYKGAEESWRHAVDIDQNFKDAYYNLAMTLQLRGDFAGAESSYRQAIAIDSKYAEAYCNLGLTLLQQGRFQEALQAINTGHSIGTSHGNWRYPSQQWMQQTKRFLELEKRLPAVIKGDGKPSGVDEYLQFGDICRYKKQFDHSVRFYSEAFSLDPKLNDDFQMGKRYHAATSAIMASRADVDQSTHFGDDERAGLRKQALQWLRAHLAWQKTLIKDGAELDRSQMQQALYLWINDPLLFAVRDADALDQLASEERESWKALWLDVKSLHGEVTKVESEVQQ